jgi:hypothetical protein
MIEVPAAVPFDLQRLEVIGSCGEVNDLIGRLLGEAAARWWAGCGVWRGQGRLGYRGLGTRRALAHIGRRPIAEPIGECKACRRANHRREYCAGLSWGSFGEFRPMTDKCPPTKQLPALLAFAEACGTRASALRRDECGDWAIWGSNGHVYAFPRASK